MNVEPGWLKTAGGFVRGRQSVARETNDKTLRETDVNVRSDSLKRRAGDVHVRRDMFTELKHAWHARAVRRRI